MTLTRHGARNFTTGPCENGNVTRSLACDDMRAFIFPLQTEVALVYDAVILFFKSLAELTNSQNDVKTKSLNCNKRDGWEMGSSLLNFMKSVTKYIYFFDIMTID